MSKKIQEVPSNIGKNSSVVDNNGNFILNLNTIPEYANTENNSEYSGIFNTQEINLDWSKFENHVFFSSAKVKIDTAFNKIINEYPFDGNEQQIITFLESLTGFEKWIFDSFPRSTGSLHFMTSGSSGVYFEIIEPAGSIFSDLSNNDNVKKIINFNDSFSIQFNLLIPNIQNDNQVIFQKQELINNKSVGIICYLTSSIDTTKTKIKFSINSKNNLESFVEAEIVKGEFKNISFICDFIKNKLFLYIDGILTSTSYQINQINSLFANKNFLIGSGTNWVTNTENLQFNQLFSGSMDEFKIWNKILDQDKIINFNKPIFSQTDLLVYYKFNEPPTQIASQTSLKNRIILDYSGNSLHTYIIDSNFYNQNYTLIRSYYDATNKIDSQYYYYCPVLFIKHNDIINLKLNLELEADNYDIQNPNLITKLVPKHYLTNDIFTILNEDGTEETVTDNSVLLTFLYSYAKLFDEMKIYLDSFSKLQKLGYSDQNNVPDKFILNLFKHFGFEKPEFFQNKSIINEQDTLLIEYDKIKSFNKIKNFLLRRVLTTLPQLIKVKGTVNSIEMFMRSIGIEPNNQFILKEHGGSNIKKVNELRDIRNINLNFFKINSSQYIQSPLLKGNYLNFNNITQFYTANSWSFECLYRLYKSNNDYYSLVRFYSDNIAKKYLICNIIVDLNSITLYVDADEYQNNKLVLTINDINLLDGNIFHLSFGKNKENKKYYLSVIKQIEGEIEENYYIEKEFIETINENNSIFYKTQTYNNNGIYFEIGDKNDESYDLIFLNKNPNNSPQRNCSFLGEVSQIRFWTKCLSKIELYEHSKNYESIGTINTLNTKTFDTNKIIGEVPLQKFERLLLNISCNQDEKLPISNQISLFDYSGNQFDLNAINIIENNFIAYKQKISKLPNSIDSSISKEKIRVRSYLNYENLTSYSRQAPVYSLQENDLFNDNSIFSIEYSLANILSSDIMNIFSSIDELENYIGNIENLYSYEYKNLNSLREIYFLKLDDKINFKAFYNIFKWFDTTLENFIQQILPRKTKFLGVNFIVEQHQLERSKFEHKNNTQYTGLTDNSNLLNNRL